MTPPREEAIQAFHILNGLLGDLVASAQVRRFYLQVYEAGNAGHEVFTCVSRMCLSTLILVLCKWVEFYDHFHRVIPGESRPAAKALRKEIRARKVLEFRNKVVGHIWDKSANRPLTSEEIEASINAIVKDDPTAFAAWCGSEVASVVESTRSSIQAAFELEPSELFPDAE